MKLLKSLLKQIKGKKNNYGAITVFISIVLSAIFLLIGVFTDAARLQLARSQIERASKTALSSVMACYQNDLKDEYGIFGLYLDKAEMQESYEEYLVKNLNIYYDQNYLYDYSIENINIDSPYNLLNRNIFEKQIMEFMKYRAPYEIASDLANKIDGIKNISAGAKVYKRVMETDKQASELGNLQLSLEEGAGKINTSGISTQLAELKNNYLNQNSKISQYTQKLSTLQKEYSNAKDKKLKEKLLQEISIFQEDIIDFITTKEKIKREIVDSVNQYKSINSQAKDMASTIVNKKELLLVRIKDEIQYTKENQYGIKELQKSYQDSFTSMQNIINQDNSAEIVSKIEDNILSCESILNSVNSNENDFLGTLDKLSSFENINYTFNKTKPAQSEDEDNRDKVIQVLKEAMNPQKELKTIDSASFEKLPSHAEYGEENQAITWDNMTFTDESCAIQNLDYLSANESKFEKITDMITEELYVNEYIMGTFKHGVPILKGDAEKASYNLRSRDKTKRDAFFSAFEVEYIINGNRDEAVNELLTKSEILAIRLGSNVIHIYTDSSKMARISSLAAALSTWSAGLSTPLVQTMLIFSWAMMESLYDMDQLEKGERVLLFKTEEHWKTDISGAVSKNKVPNVENNPLNLSYQDYLKVFLLIMDKNKKLARVQDLVQLNTTISNSDFLLEDCKVCLQADTTVSMRNLFISFSSISSVEQNVSRSYIHDNVLMGY